MKVVIEYAVRFDNRPVELWRVAGRIVHRIPSIAVASRVSRKNLTNVDV